MRLSLWLLGREVLALGLDRTAEYEYLDNSGLITEPSFDGDEEYEPYEEDEFRLGFAGGSTGGAA